MSLLLTVVHTGCLLAARSVPRWLCHAVSTQVSRSELLVLLMWIKMETFYTLCASVQKTFGERQNTPAARASQTRSNCRYRLTLMDLCITTAMRMTTWAVSFRYRIHGLVRSALPAIQRQWSITLSVLDVKPIFLRMKLGHSRALNALTVQARTEARRSRFADATLALNARQALKTHSKSASHATQANSSLPTSNCSVQRAASARS